MAVILLSLALFTNHPTVTPVHSDNSESATATTTSFAFTLTSTAHPYSSGTNGFYHNYYGSISPRLFTYKDNEYGTVSGTLTVRTSPKSDSMTVWTLMNS